MFITMYPLSRGCLQQENAPNGNKTQIITNWFVEHNNELILLKWLPQNTVGMW